MKKDFGSPFQATATHATSAVATVSGITDKTHYITDIAGSTDKAGALLLVKQGSTVIWQVQMAASAAGNCAFQQSFQTPLKAPASTDVSITVDGSSVCDSNIAGFTV